MKLIITTHGKVDTIFGDFRNAVAGSSQAKSVLNPQDGEYKQDERLIVIQRTVGLSDLQWKHIEKERYFVLCGHGADTEKEWKFYYNIIDNNKLEFVAYGDELSRKDFFKFCKVLVIFLLDHHPDAFSLVTINPNPKITPPS